jgi:hypothetical protein
MPSAWTGLNIQTPVINEDFLFPSVQDVSVMSTVRGDQYQARLTKMRTDTDGTIQAVQVRDVDT